MEGSLKLANGETYVGQWLGDGKDYTDELIFYTGMVYFQEFITDPAIKGKIVVASYPGIFNCKVDPNRYESNKIQIGGLITQQELANQNFDSTHLINEFAKAGVPILSGVDTRTIVKKLHTLGEMPAMLLSAKNKSNDQFEEHLPLQRTNKQLINANGDKHLVVIDFGINHSLTQFFVRNNFKLTIVSNEITAKEIKALKPDGIVFSGGPGNPLHYEKNLSEYAEAARSYPTIAFGIGYQVLALSFGAKVEKMKCGHRGYKHPVIHVDSQKVFMTKQNHGFKIADLENSSLQLSYRNVHDGTIEGFVHEHHQLSAFQFYPDEKNDQLTTIMFQAFYDQLEHTKGVTVYA